MILRIILLVLSLSGYGYFLYRKLNIKVEFIPFIIFCGIGLTMIVAGVLNCMATIVWLIFAVGFMLLIYSVLSRKLPKRTIMGLITPGTIFFAVSVIWFCILFIGLRYTEYDNFTHWGLAVKNMLAENALPSFKNDIIVHQTYPMGSSVFIYFIVKIIGNYSEACTIMAQMLLILASITTLFAFINTKKMWTKIVMTFLVGFTALMLICIGGYTTNLIVDALLPLVAVGCFAVIIYYRNDLKLACTLCSVIIPFIYLVKTSGILFVVFYIILLIGLAIRELIKKPIELRKQYLKSTGICIIISIAAPFIAMFIWDKHVDLVYEAPDSTTHAISSEYFAQTLNSKTDADKKEITDNFINKVVDHNFTPNRMMIYFNIALITLGIAIFIMNKKLPRWIIAALVLGNLAYIIYMVSLYGMYMVSMPLSGAKNLSSLNRYCNTILAYLAGVFTMAVAIQFGQLLDNAKKVPAAIVLKGLYCIALLCIAITQNKTTLERFYKKPVYDDSSAPVRIEAITDGVKFPSDTSYFVYMPSSETDNGYSKYIFRYNTLNKNYKFSTNFSDEQKMRDAILESEYLFMVDENEDLTRFAIDNGFKLIKENVYKINN